MKISDHFQQFWKSSGTTEANVHYSKIFRSITSLSPGGACTAGGSISGVGEWVCEWVRGKFSFFHSIGLKGPYHIGKIFNI